MDGQEHGPNDPVADFASAWVSSTRHLTNSVKYMYQGVAEANRAFFPMRRAQHGDDSSGDESAVDDTLDSADRGEGTEELAYVEESWSVERTVESPEHISVGDHVRFSKVLSDEDVRAFAQVSGDTNRLHLDDEFVEDTRFGRRIVHGTLASGLISAALARLPGLTIYLSQDLRFLAPVDIGDRVTAVVEIVEDLGDARYRLTTSVHAGDDDDDPDQVIDGEAVVLIDDLPDE